MTKQPYYNISIDAGGTFTDCVAADPQGCSRYVKVLSAGTLRGKAAEWINRRTFRSENGWPVEKDIFRGYEVRFSGDPVKYIALSYDPVRKTFLLDREVGEAYGLPDASFQITGGEEAPVFAARLACQAGLSEPLPPIRMKLGSTKGVNALLERKGAPTAFFVTRGFKDLLAIGDQQRPDIFALKIEKPEPLYVGVEEIEERLDARGNVVEPLVFDEALIRQCENLKDQGVVSAAVALMHSYKNPAHERLLKEKLSAYFPYVSISSDLSGQIKILHRAHTCLVNAYLEPVLDQYLQKVAAPLGPGALQIMNSAGGLSRPESFFPKDSLFSGPAGGVGGAVAAGRAAGFDRLIGFDMGGTSADVARYDGAFDYRFSVEIGAAQVFSPALAIETVAAGGGSICSFDGHTLRVGPESAGSSPGPACYGAGGPLTITDVHLLLGRLDEAQFAIPLFKANALSRFEEIAEAVEAVKKDSAGRMSPEARRALLEGFLIIANERMADVIRKISVAKGYDPAEYAMVAFGGAGGLHACAVAERLGMVVVVLPQYAGLLSAYGISRATVERFAERQVLEVLDHTPPPELKGWIADLENRALNETLREGIAPEKAFIKKRSVFLRFVGQDAALEIDAPNRYFSSVSTDFDGAGFYEFLKTSFQRQYQLLYGHWVEGRAIEIESLRVVSGEAESAAAAAPPPRPESYEPKPAHHISAGVGSGGASTPVFRRQDLRPGAIIAGPALLIDPFSSTVAEQGFSVMIDKDGTAIMRKTQVQKSALETAAAFKKEADPVSLALFSNRFTSLALDMGALLERTALSVNVRERLDFSCALLDAEGFLIANAPHIPVHLGSLGVCARRIVAVLTPENGDTIVSNHPKYGGSHLPDVTLLTPVFASDAPGAELLGYVCNRCHHSEIGGDRPGSMPPSATRLSQEGVVIFPDFLVRKGVARWDWIKGLLENSPLPSRAPEENLADLNAALAANLSGMEALRSLAREHGVETVRYYMEAVKNHAAVQTRAAIQRFDPSKIYEAEERLDDGSSLKVAVRFPAQETDRLVIDFTGSAPVHPGNLNGNEAITTSVVLYALRLLIRENIPLNEGILQNVDLILPKNSIVNPDFPDDPAQCPAVVGGNVELSQRLTDTLLKALGVCAASQGTMNNLLFGSADFGYYETIGGGAGAGDGFDGASGVQVHMTNTRITDPEIMEQRYPVRLEAFEIRRGTGGQGRFRGGNGILRRIRFLAPVQVSVLTQRRLSGPYGMRGGAPGAPGRQTLIRANGERLVLKSVDQAEAEAGDVLLMETPGGGGYGQPVR